MPTIQQAIHQAASRFALEVVSILRAATLAEIAALTGKDAELLLSPPAARGRKKARRAGAASAARGTVARLRRGGHKRTGEEVARIGERVLEYLKTTRQEVAVSTIAAALKLHPADLALPLSRLRQGAKVKTHGRRRSMVYRVG